MRPAIGIVRRATLAACATLLVALAAAGGCMVSAPTPVVRPALHIAHVELVNLSECDWRVTLASSVGPDARSVSLPARETAHLELASGDYTITQTALTGLSGSESTRQIHAHFATGETYRWRLVTLFSATAVEP